LVVEDKLWIGTPRGLYQYHPDEDTWAIYGTHNGLPSNDIQILQYDGEFLWVVTPDGVAAGDIRLNKWLIYTKENGLPANTVFSLDFQEDYVWAGTDRGAARFDKLIQEWEQFTVDDGLPDSVVYDIVVDGDLVYFGTAQGLTEYEINFEKWRYYPIGSDTVSNAIRFIYPTTDYLWLFTERGPIRFSKDLHSTLSFPGFDALAYSRIRDLVVDDERFWVATSDGVLIYDPANNLWRHFQEEVQLPSPSVRAFAFIQQDRWFVTDRGIALFDEGVKSWQFYGKAHGLSSEQYEAVASFGGKTFLMNRGTVDYFMPQENRWRIYPLKDVSLSAAEKTPYVSLDQEKGSYLQMTPEVRLSLSGSRFTSRYQKTHEYQIDTKQAQGSDEWAHRRDLKAQLSLPGGRTVNGFYNDTDFSQTLYGVRYKGQKGDIVQEVNWGDVRYEQGKGHLVPSIGVFGSSARLEAGSKTERYKRSLVSARGWSGEKTTGFEAEFFTGHVQEGEVTVRDVDYIRNTVFCWDTTAVPTVIDEGSEQIWMDDGDPGTNTANTREDALVGGIVGDFDLLQSYQDYRIDYRKGEIHFRTPVSDDATVVISATSMGIPQERVIKTPGTSPYALVNRYFVGGMEIIPYTFQLQVFDSLGMSRSLAEFGLDADGDGRVDAAWMDYREGILSFPTSKPFLDDVYDVLIPSSHYRMQARFETEISIFVLRHNRLIRGSEIVTVDGEVLTAGEDYVLDYTGGTLLILKEGVLAEDSETEVRYEYYRESRETFHRAGLGFGPSDNVLVELSGFAFDEEQGPDAVDPVKGLDFFGEFKWRLKGLDFKLTPEFARGVGNAQNGNGMHLRTDISSQRVRVFSEYEKYDEDFKTLHPRKFQLGSLANRMAAGVTVLPTDFLDITGQWSRQKAQTANQDREPLEENLSGRVLLSKRLLPAVSLSVRRRTLKADDFNSQKETVKGELEYQVPRNLLNKLSFKSMRVYGVWRKSWEDIDTTHTSSNGPLRKQYDNKYVRFDFSPMNLVQINTYYRGESVDARDEHMDSSLPLNRQQKWFFDATVDRIRGMNMNVRYQSEVTERFSFSETATSSVDLQRSLQSSIRFFPGQWVRFLAPFTFEINYQPNWKGYLEDNTEKLRWGEKLWQLSASDDLSSFEDNTLYQFRGEWRPSALIFFYSSVESYRIVNQNIDSRSLTDVRRLHHKLEYRPTIQSLITLQYFYSKHNTQNYSKTFRHNPMIWVEHRWSDKLLTKLNVAYLKEEKYLGNILESMGNFTPLLGFTFRWRRSDTGQSMAEIRNDLSCSFYRSHRDGADDSQNSFSNTLAVDYLPASILILRFRLTTTYKDRLYSAADNLSNTLELRLTAQF